MRLKPKPNQPLVSWAVMPSPRPGGDVQPEMPSRLIGPEDVAALMVFLCGPEGAAITGAVLPIDGGWSAS